MRRLQLLLGLGVARRIVRQLTPARMKASTNRSSRRSRKLECELVFDRLHLALPDGIGMMNTRATPEAIPFEPPSNLAHRDASEPRRLGNGVEPDIDEGLFRRVHVANQAGSMPAGNANLGRKESTGSRFVVRKLGRRQIRFYFYISITSAIRRSANAIRRRCRGKMRSEPSNDTNLTNDRSSRRL